MTQLLPATAIGAPVTAQIGPTVKFNARPDTLAVQANLVGGSSGSSISLYVQTSLDKGANWIDIASLAFTTAAARVVVNMSSRTSITSAYTATDGTLATGVKDGILGDQFRTKLTTTGTYSGTTIAVDISGNQV